MPEPLLEQLFDSPVKVRLLKLFLYHPEGDFTIEEMRLRLLASRRSLKKELKKFLKMGFVREFRTTRGVVKRKKMRKIKVRAYKIQKEFPFYEELRMLLSKSSPASKKRMLKRIEKLGSIKLALLAGVFVNSDISRADILLVGDRIDQKKLAKFIKDLEAEVGAELAYTAIPTKEFEYRMSMFDRFLRDMLEYPHEKLINKLKL